MTHLELVIYLYITTNKNGETFALSCTEISEIYDKNKRRLQGTVNSLIEKGYLEHIKDNQYVFHDKPAAEGK